MGSGGGTTDERVSVPMGLLPGIKFSPTDKELLSFYLKKKIAGEDSEFSNIMPEINLREHEPRDLPTGNPLIFLTFSALPISSFLMLLCFWL